MGQQAEDRCWSYLKIKLMICFMALEVRIRSQYVSNWLTHYERLCFVICKRGFKISVRYFPSHTETIFMIFVLAGFLLQNSFRNILFFQTTHFSDFNNLLEYTGAPGWLSQLSVQLRHGSWSRGLWVQAPHRGLCADSSEPGVCFGFYLTLSAPPPLTLCLSLKNK